MVDRDDPLGTPSTQAPIHLDGWEANLTTVQSHLERT